MQYLSKREVKNLLKPYGINYQGTSLFIRQKDKIYLVSKDIQKINPTDYKIISSGLYIGKIEKFGFRLTIEGTQLLKPKTNVLQTKNLDWLQGKDIETKEKFQGFVAIKYKNDFIGSGLYSKGKILNFVPKVRRIPAQ